MRNTNYYEMGLVHPKAPASHDSRLYKDGYRDTLDAIDRTGVWRCRGDLAWGSRSTGTG